MADASSVEYLVSVPADVVSKFDDAASLFHMMNLNTFTCGAYRLKDAADVDSVAAAIKEYVMGKQWMCGFPDKLIVVSVGNYIVECFGAEDLVNTFRDKLGRGLSQRERHHRRGHRHRLKATKRQNGAQPFLCAVFETEKNMLFSSIPFLYWFLPCVLLVYFLAPRRLKNTVLLLASLVFYGWGEPRYLLVMLASIVQGYVFGLLIGKLRGRPAAKACLAASVVLSFAALAYFKYADFFLANFNALTGLSVPLLRVAPPRSGSAFTRSRS